MKKNKRIFVFITIMVIITLIGVASIIIKSNSNTKSNEFTILEKKWMEKNQSEVINVSVLNDIPLFGTEGDGVFFDFLKSFTRDNELKFNLLPYNLGKKSESDDYVFEINNKAKLNDNELLFYKDNFVLISNDNNSIKEFSDLDNMTVGTLESDLNNIKNYFDGEEKILFNSYSDINALVTALNNNEILYAAIPKGIYMDKILDNNFYIVYNMSELYSNYILKVNGSNKTLNSIITKYYNKWSQNRLSKAYNKRFLDLYFLSKNIDEVTKADFSSKEYTYGYIKNLPYESKINDSFIGFNSEILNDFGSRMGLSFKIKEFNDSDSLLNALNNESIDLAFNYYDFSELSKSQFDYTFSPYNQKIVVLTNINNTNVSVSSLKSLNGLDVMMIDNKVSKYIENKTSINVDKYKNASSLFKKMKEDSIIILDYNTYNMYRNTKLNTYNVIYDQKIDSEFNFIVVNSSKNKAFNGLFKFYISTLDNGIYQAKAYSKLESDNKILDMRYIYMMVILAIALLISLVVYKKKKNVKVIKKGEKMRYVDHLTSLKNRNYLNENYHKWQNNKIYPQAIIIIELSKIGHINDVYGHEEGDMVIKKAANILITTQLEQSDIVRTNGDEFLIYLVGYEESKIITYMRKLYKELKNLPYNFGASLGYSMILDDIKTIDDAMNEAVLEIKTSKEMNNDNND